MTESQANKLQALAWASLVKQNDCRLAENLANGRPLLSFRVWDHFFFFVQRIIQLKVSCMLEMARLPGVPAPNSLRWKDL